MEYPWYSTLYRPHSQDIFWFIVECGCTIQPGMDEGEWNGVRVWFCFIFSWNVRFVPLTATVPHLTAPVQDWRPWWAAPPLATTVPHFTALIQDWRPWRAAPPLIKLQQMYHPDKMEKMCQENESRLTQTKRKKKTQQNLWRKRKDDEFWQVIMWSA